MKVPCAPINKFDALNDEQVKHRNMIVEVEHPDGGFVLVCLIQMRNLLFPPHLIKKLVKVSR